MSSSPPKPAAQSIEALGARTARPHEPSTCRARSPTAPTATASTPRSTPPASRPAVESALACVGERRPLISVAIYDRPLPTPLINLVLRERRIQGTICYTGDDYRAVIDLMARGHYDTTGWVDTIPLSGVIEQGFEELRAGRKMKLLVDPTL